MTASSTPGSPDWPAANNRRTRVLFASVDIGAPPRVATSTAGYGVADTAGEKGEPPLVQGLWGNPNLGWAPPSALSCVAPPIFRPGGGGGARHPTAPPRPR